MMKRKIIEIDEKKCNGCGICIPNCPEGAIQIIDDKARLISDIFCDGLGACIGNCPQGAIKTIEREAQPYNEKKTMRKNIIKAGENTIIAHLRHLKEHGEDKLYQEAMEVLKEEKISIDKEKIMEKSDNLPCGCPGSAVKDFSDDITCNTETMDTRSSQLRQWPVQLTLVPPNASYFQGKDVILVADCVAYSLCDFHKDCLKGRSLAIACPKLDCNLEDYKNKLMKMVDEAKINTLTVMTMEVPCCSGLISIAKKALSEANRKIPIKSIVISIKGEKMKEEWI